MCKSRGGCPGLSVLTSLLVPVDVNLRSLSYTEPYLGIGHSLSLICQLTSEDIEHHFIIIINDLSSSSTINDLSPVYLLRSLVLYSVYLLRSWAIYLIKKITIFCLYSQFKNYDLWLYSQFIYYDLWLYNKFIYHARK